MTASSDGWRDKAVQQFDTQNVMIFDLLGIFMVRNYRKFWLSSAIYSSKYKWRYCNDILFVNFSLRRYEYI